MSSKSDLDNSFTLSNSPSPIKGLKGNAQRAFDLAGELYTLIQQWNLYCVTGRNIITNILSLKEESWHSPERVPLHRLEHFSDQLSSIVKEMENIVKQMEKVKDQYKAIGKLEEFQQSKQTSNSQDTSLLFLTWPTAKFGQTAEIIKNAYAEELRIKVCIMENIAHCDNQDVINFHKIAWVHQTNITQSVKLLLEALLLETGQKQ